MEILQQIFDLCVVPLLGILTAYLVNFISKKAAEASSKTNSVVAQTYINLLANTIKNCVIATNQTYVEALKDKNAFTEEAQKEAFTKTYNAVVSTLTEEATTYLQTIYGDLNTYIEQAIEAEVNKEK